MTTSRDKQKLMKCREFSNGLKRLFRMVDFCLRRIVLGTKNVAGVLLLFAVVTTSCGTSSSGGQIVAQSVALPVSATEDAFSFPNFGSDVIREFLNSDDLMLMFGPEVCTDGEQHGR